MTFQSNIDPEALGTIPALWSRPPESSISHLQRTNRKTGEVVVIDYVDHAQTRAILTEIDPLWTYEFTAVADDGLPRVRQVGETIYLGIRLTVHGKTFPGIGSAETSSPDVLKELIGDALRNAAMTFGVSLSLWSKAETLPTEAPVAAPQHGPAMPVPEPPSIALEGHRERLRGRIENLSPSARGTLRGSMQSRQLSLNHATTARELTDIETLLIATELGEAEREKLDAARAKMEQESLDG